MKANVPIPALLCAAATAAANVAYVGETPGPDPYLRDYVIPDGHAGTARVVAAGGDGMVEVNDGEFAATSASQTPFPVEAGDQISGRAGDDGTVLVVVEHHPANTGPSASPSSVVIPSDANGDVEVRLEQSEDLVNWTDAAPGTYSASADKRFFRVRIID
jgi:hypothetical protein